MKMRLKFYFCIQMEKTGSLKYLKVITIILLISNTLFIGMNSLKGFWDWTFYFGNGGWGPFIRFANYLGKSYSVVYGLLYILEICFLIGLNHFVKKQRIGKGYHILIILLSFLPVLNLILFYILKRKLNKKVFDHSRMDGVRSNWKISFIWILMILLVIFVFIIVPFLTFYITVPEVVSTASYYLHYSYLVTDCCLLITSLIWFFYYLEFQRMLDRIDLTQALINDNSLLDS